MKCLKYDTPDALSKPDLDFDLINSMVFKGDVNQDYRIFFTPFSLNTVDSDRSELRFFISQFVPDNIQLTKVKVMFQLIVSNKVWRLDEGRIRSLVLVSEILKTLQGQQIGFVGELLFNDPIKLRYWNDSYTGYELVPDTRSN